MGIRASVSMTLGFLVVLATGCSADDAQPVEDSADENEGAIVNGKVTHGFKGVGVLAWQDPNSDYYSMCSASLIATGRREEPYRVLTAAHCVLTEKTAKGVKEVGPANPKRYHFLLGVDDVSDLWYEEELLENFIDGAKKRGGLDIPITDIRVAGTPKDWKMIYEQNAFDEPQDDAFYHSPDVASLGIDASSVPLAFRKAALPVAKTLLTTKEIASGSYTTVGFGAELPALDTATGIKRSYSSTVQALGKHYFVVGKPGQAENSCYGDSGGPVLRMVNNRPEIVGVTSVGDPQCRSQSVPARVDTLHDFIVGGSTNPTEKEGEITGCNATANQCIGETLLHRCVNGEFAYATTCASYSGFCGTAPPQKGGGAQCMSAKDAGVKQFVLNDFEKSDSDMFNYLPADQRTIETRATRIVDTYGNHALRLSGFTKGFNDVSKWDTTLSMSYTCDNNFLKDLPHVRFRVRFPSGHGSFTVELRGPKTGCDGDNVSTKAIKISAPGGCHADRWQTIDLPLSEFDAPAGFFPRYIRFGGFNASKVTSIDIDDIVLSAR